MSASVWAPGTAIDASDVVKVQRFTATLNQTVFVLTSFVYAIGNNSLQVYTDGIFQGVSVDFTETSSSSFTLAEGVPAGTIVTAVGQVGLENGSQYADEAAVSAAAALASETAAAASAVLADTSADAAVVSAAAALASENAAEAAAVNVIDWDWLGAWVTATAYKVNNSVSAPAGTYQGWSVICLVDHTSGTFATDYGAGKWGVLAQRGAVGAGTGDMLAANNLSDVVSTASARTNLGGTATGVSVFTAASTTAARSAIAAAGSGDVTASGLTQATARILGRSTVGTGAVEEITVGSGLTLSAGTLSSSESQQLQFQLFNSNGTWTCPAGVTRVKATVIGAGGGGNNDKGGGGGGNGGYASGVYTVVPTTGYSVTVGPSVGEDVSGGSSAFSSFLSASGGTANNVGGANGAGSGGNIVNGSVIYGRGALDGTSYGLGGLTGTQGGVLIEYVG